MIRRTFRIVAALGLLGGLGFALAKLVQSRRSPQSHMLSGDTAVLPKRSETPLVEPKMLHGLNLKSPDQALAEREDGQGIVGPQAPPAAAAAAARAAAKQAAAAPAPAAPDEPAPTPAATSGPKLWVDPDGATCPTSHPVKAKLASGIFHLPGMTAYERTTPDRCYQDEASAEADGLRKAKR